MTILRRAALAAIAAVFGLGLMAGGAQAGTTLDRIMSSGKMVLAVDSDYPPFSFLGSDNEMTGFDVAVSSEVARRLGVELEVVTPGWDVITAGHWAGRWDICIGSMTPTKARAEVIDFPAIYYYTPATVIVHKDNTTIHGPEDLTGKRVGVEAATTYEAYLQGNLTIDALDAPPVVYKAQGADIVAYDTEPVAMEDLALGDGVRLDAMITGLLTSLDAIKAGKPFKVVGDPVFLEPIAVAVDKAEGDKEFEAKIVEIIDAMRADGTLAKLSEQWIGADVTEKPAM